jgi:hypothetical protein
MKKTILLAAAVLAAGAAAADQLPHRKPGLWQITNSMPSGKMPPMSSKLCIDARTEEAMMSMGQAASKKMCSRRTLKMEGKVATMDSTCKFGRSTTTTHSTITFSGDAAYRTETHVRYSPPVHRRAESVMTQDARWMGPCPPDMKPGDMIGPNGMTMNMSGAR